MKKETKIKLQRAWLRLKTTAQEVAPGIIFGSSIGMLLVGYFGAIENSKQIRKVNEKLQMHDKVINHNADVLEQHADAGNAVIAQGKEMQKQIEELQRQNNLLMEKALQETKGAA